MLPANWPRWIIAPIGFALAVGSICLGLILVQSVQAFTSYPEPTPTPPRLAYAAPLSGECTSCHTNKETLETVASAEEAQRLYIEPSQTESLHGRLGCVTCHQGTPDTEDISAAHTELVADPSFYFQENCLLCHRDLPNEFPDDNLRAPHDQVVRGLAENLTCGDCHGAVGHGYEAIISMAACIDCHEERGLPVDCEVCHMEMAAWSPDTDCALCHLSPQVESRQDPNLLAYAHAQEGLVCLDCHDLAVLQTVHEAAVPGTPIKERKFEMEFCFGCHLPNEHTSYEEIIERTKDLAVDPKANPHDAHFGEMECRICHKMHKESEDYCAQCHSFGWKVP